MRRILLGFALYLVGAVIFCSATFSLAIVSHSFSTTDAGVVDGSLVSSVSDNSGGVELASTDNGARLIGVVINDKQSLLNVGSSGASSVQVAVSGTVDVLASTIAGNIKTGDQVTVSPISGVGMRASNGLRAIGVAQSPLDSKTPGAKARTVYDRSGNTNQIYIGYISVFIVIADTNGGPPAVAPGFLGNIQTAEGTIIGHQVSSLQATMGLIVALVGMISLIALIYSAIRGGLLSIARNPLAKKSIYRSLIQIMVMALLIGVISVVIIYLMLR